MPRPAKIRWCCALATVLFHVVAMADPTQTAARGTDIASVEVLLGFAQLPTTDGHFVAVFSRREADHAETLTLYRFDDASGRAREVKKVDLGDSGAWAADATTIGDDLAVALEINRSDAAIRVVRAPFRKVLGEAAPPPSAPPRALELSDARLATVPQSTELAWNTLDRSPRRWLFAPRFVRGASATSLVANTADGQAMRFGSAKEEAAPGLARAARPQALDLGGHRYLAYQRLAPRQNPFDARQFRNTSPILAAELWATTDGSAAQLVAKDVTAFALAGETTTPTLFAVQRQGATSKLVTYAWRDRAWVAGGTRTIEQEVDGLDASYVRGAWQLVCSVRGAAGWTLRGLRP